MKFIPKIFLILLIGMIELVKAQDSSIVIGDTVYSEGISVSIDDLKQRADYAREGIYYSFGSKGEEKIYNQYLNSRIFKLERDLKDKSKEIDSLKQLVNDFIKEQSKFEKKQKDGWRKMEMYLSMEQVKKLLGEPQAITMYTASTKYWYGNGFVEFNAYKKVCEWAEPRTNRTEIIKY